jgi:hypothetical protein
MSTRSVRLDEETEQALEALTSTTGASVSEVLKRGVLALREASLKGPIESAWHVYSTLDLGPGGYAAAPARQSKRALRTVLRRRDARRP